MPAVKSDVGMPQHPKSTRLQRAAWLQSAHAKAHALLISHLPLQALLWAHQSPAPRHASLHVTSQAADDSSILPTSNVLDGSEVLRSAAAAGNGMPGLRELLRKRC